MKSPNVMMIFSPPQSRLLDLHGGADLVRHEVPLISGAGSSRPGRPQLPGGPGPQREGV